MKKSTYKEEKITINEFGTSAIFEYGNWASSYPFIKLGYENADVESSYFDTAYYIKKGNVVVGYFISKNIVNLNNDDTIPLYSKKLVLYDFAISARAYSKFGKLLINYMLKYAKNNGYSCVEVAKNAEYNFFIDFLCRHYNVVDCNDKLRIVITEPRIKISEKHLIVYQNDKIDIDDLYFLYDLDFTVLKTIVKLKLDENNSILINRLTGKIIFPTGVEVIGDDITLNSITRNIIFFICNKHQYNVNEKVQIDFRLINPNNFSIITGNMLYINKDIEQLIEDLDYLLNMKNSSITHIYSYSIEYNMHQRSFGQRIGGKSVVDLISKYCLSCDSKAVTLTEKLKEKKIVNDFNQKLIGIKRFDFQFGNPFCGIKKLSIRFEEEVKILSNGSIENSIIPNADEIRNELSNFYFSNWINKYDGNKKAKFENAWTITLNFENETLEYCGLDDYPKVWKYVVWFVEKYSNFVINEE